jgi:hypothetical protein
VPEEADSATNGSEPGVSLEAPVQTGEVRPVEPMGAVLDRPLRIQLAVPVVAAAGGFLAGVATWVMVRVLRRRRDPARSRGGLLGRRQRRDVVASRSFLVDVHLLRR